jgi:putative SOS response-associated peptidase YedK
MLTINAEAHPLMRLFHKPADEKRMVVVLQPDAYQDWLEAPPLHSMAFMRPIPAEALQVTLPAVATAPR